MNSIHDILQFNLIFGIKTILNSGIYNLGSVQTVFGQGKI